MDSKNKGKTKGLTIGCLVALGCAGLFIALLAFIIFSSLGGSGYRLGGGESLGCKTIPDPQRKILTKASQKWKIRIEFLAAVGEMESSFISGDINRSSWAVSSAGAQGPFQFMPDTWKRYKQDAGGDTYAQDSTGTPDGNKNINSVWDAAFGAAEKLALGGAAGNTTDYDQLYQAALFYNNHSTAYADGVMVQYYKYKCQSQFDISNLGFIKKVLKYNGGDGTRRLMNDPGPTAIVLHWSAGSTLEGLMGALESRKLICQLGIDVDGITYQFMNRLNEVPACQNAWNSHGIGIEIVGTGKNALMSNEKQFKGVVTTVKKLMKVYNIPAINDTDNQRGILGHYQVNPRKQDPSQKYLFKVINAVK